MSDTNLDTIVRRIQKLLALANDGRGNENEASAAAEKAMAMAAEHGLELAQLEAKAESTATLGGKRDKKVHDRAAMYNYQRTLMAAVAETHFCKHWIAEVSALSFGKERRVKRHVLLGRDINVQLSLMLYDYIIETMDRLLPYQGMEKRGRQALLWLEGCADRVAARLAGKRVAMEKEAKARQQEAAARAKHPGAAPSSGSDLVLSDVYSSEADFNHDFEMGWEPGTTARNKRVELAQYQARQAEWEAGREARQAKEKAKRDAIRAGVEGRYDADLINDIVQYLSWGFYSEEEAVKKAKADRAARARASRPETEAERRARERRQANWEYDQARKQARMNAKYGSPEYQAGKSTGASIGLDTQVEHKRKERIA